MYLCDILLCIQKNSSYILGRIKLKVCSDSKFFWICMRECENKTRILEKNTDIIDQLDSFKT